MDETVSPDQLTCDYCSEIVFHQNRNCINCGYPIKGSQEEQRQFISFKGRLKHEVKELKTKVENAQITFYVLSGLFFLIGVISYSTLKEEELSLDALIGNLILCAIFLALAGWSKSKPVVCILLGLIIYIISQIIGVIVGYSIPFNGILMKGIVIVVLIKGLISALDAERIKREHNIS